MNDVMPNPSSIEVRFLAFKLIFNAEKNDIEEDGQIFDYIMDAHHRMLDNDEDGVIIIRTRDFDCGLSIHR